MMFILSNYGESYLFSELYFATLFRRVYKMLIPRNIVTFVVVTYLVLLIVFFAFKEPQKKNNACKYGQSCIRFCCDDAKLCKTNVIEKFFNASLIPKLEGDNEKNFIMLFGKPKCATLVSFESDREWQFSKVRFD